MTPSTTPELKQGCADVTIKGSIPEPLMVGPSGLARLLEVSTREIRRLRVQGQLPDPDWDRSPRCPRWGVDSVRAWVAAGCPPSEKWKVVKRMEKSK